MISYSATTKGFYDSALHGTNIPPDAVGVDLADFEALLNAQAQGAQIVPGEGGAPALLWPAPPTEA